LAQTQSAADYDPICEFALWKSVAISPDVGFTKGCPASLITGDGWHLGLHVIRHIYNDHLHYAFKETLAGVGSNRSLVD
jgi:hypothetical protein